MNYHAPRQIKRPGDIVPSGGWHYTNQRGELVYPEGYCAEVGSACHAEGHATKEEAYACFTRFLLDKRLTFHADQENPDSLQRCQAAGCKAYTSGSGVVQLGIGRVFHLCAEHRNRAEVEKLFQSVGDMTGSH